MFITNVISEADASLRGFQSETTHESVVTAETSQPNSTVESVSVTEIPQSQAGEQGVPGQEAHISESSDKMLDSTPPRGDSLETSTSDPIHELTTDKQPVLPQTHITSQETPSGVQEPCIPQGMSQENVSETSEENVLPTSVSESLPVTDTSTTSQISVLENQPQPDDISKSSSETRTLSESVGLHDNQTAQASSQMETDRTMNDRTMINAEQPLTSVPHDKAGLDPIQTEAGDHDRTSRSESNQIEPSSLVSGDNLQSNCDMDSMPVPETISENLGDLGSKIVQTSESVENSEPSHVVEDSGDHASNSVEHVEGMTNLEPPRVVKSPSQPPVIGSPSPPPIMEHRMHRRLPADPVFSGSDDEEPIPIVNTVSGRETSSSEASSQNSSARVSPTQRGECERMEGEVPMDVDLGNQGNSTSQEPMEQSVSDPISGTVNNGNMSQDTGEKEKPEPTGNLKSQNELMDREKLSEGHLGVTVKSPRNLFTDFSMDKMLETPHVERGDKMAEQSQDTQTPAAHSLETIPAAQNEARSVSHAAAGTGSSDKQETLGM